LKNILFIVLIYITFSSYCYASNGSLAAKGDLFFFGQGVEKNISKASSFYKKAKEAGEAINPFQDGVILLIEDVSFINNAFLPRNPIKALGLFKLAEIKGIKGARWGISSSYDHIANDLLKKSDYQGAFKVYEQSYLEGSANQTAIYTLAKLYHKGQGTVSNIPKAVELYLESDWVSSKSQLKSIIKTVSKNLKNKDQILSITILESFLMAVQKHPNKHNYQDLHDGVSIMLANILFSHKGQINEVLLIQSLKNVKTSQLKGTSVKLIQYMKNNNNSLK
tara:strand:- start:2231 stop:3067 length:837 start_codon:yes stop_codon:yes gene_type:complete